MVEKTTELLNFYHYELVRRSGKYNMITEAELAAESAGLDMITYRKIILEYEHLRRIAEIRYGSMDRFMRDYGRWGF